MCLSEVWQMDPFWESLGSVQTLPWKVLHMLGQGPYFHLDWMGSFNYQSWLNNTQHFATGNF